jgi:hypothetical protein
MSVLSAVNNDTINLDCSVKNKAYITGKQKIRYTLERVEKVPVEYSSVPYEIEMFRAYGKVPEKEIIPFTLLKSKLQMTHVMYDQLIHDAIIPITMNSYFHVKMDEVNHYLSKRRICRIKNFPFNVIHLNEVMLRDIDIMWYFSIEKHELYNLYHYGLPVYLFYPGNLPIEKLDFYKGVRRYRYPDILTWVMNYWKIPKMTRLSKLFTDYASSNGFKLFKENGYVQKSKKSRQ